jgi:hypothetical protein
MSEQQQPEGIWCLVANVATEQVYGGQQEVRSGTKHFSPNTKVYCFPPLWGDGYEKIRVIGRHRGSSRLVTLILPSRRLVNWRARYVCHPYVVRRMYPGWIKEQAEQMLASILFNAEADRAQEDGFQTLLPTITCSMQHGLASTIRYAPLSRAEPARMHTGDLGGRRCFLLSPTETPKQLNCW